MKKIILVVFAMCLFTSVTAQQRIDKDSLKDIRRKVEKLNHGENDFVDRLDSITSEKKKVLYVYDNRNNCIRETLCEFNEVEWVSNVAYEYTYDEQNRKTVMVDYLTEEKPYKEEYTYNEQNLIGEEIISYYSENEWVVKYRYVFEYDEAGNLVLCMYYFYMNGWKPELKLELEYENSLLTRSVSYSNNNFEEAVWFPEIKHEYFYDSQNLLIEESENIYTVYWENYKKRLYTYNEMGLCTEQSVRRYYYEEWHEEYKYCYSYDEIGNLVNKTSLKLPPNNAELVYFDMLVFAYDENNNCVEYSDYDFQYNDWVLKTEYIMTYDLSTSASDIAHLDTSWEDLGFGVPINNKLLQVVSEDNDIIVFHYASGMGLNSQSCVTLSLWPNPTCEMLSVQAEGLQRVDIFTLEGRCIATLENGFKDINVSAFATGCYLLKAVLGDGSVSVQKFVKN